MSSPLSHHWVKIDRSPEFWTHATLVWDCGDVKEWFLVSPWIVKYCRILCFRSVGIQLSQNCCRDLIQRLRLSMSPFGQILLEIRKLSMRNDGILVNRSCPSNVRKHQLLKSLGHTLIIIFLFSFFRFRLCFMNILKLLKKFLQPWQIGVKAKCLHGKDNVIPVDCFTSICLAFVTRFRCNEANEFRHALLHGLLRFFGDLGLSLCLFKWVFHDSSYVRNGKESETLRESYTGPILGCSQVLHPLNFGPLIINLYNFSPLREGDHVYSGRSILSLLILLSILGVEMALEAARSDLVVFGFACLRSLVVFNLVALILDLICGFVCSVRLSSLLWSSWPKSGCSSIEIVGGNRPAFNRARNSIWGSDLLSGMGDESVVVMRITSEW